MSINIIKSDSLEIFKQNYYLKTDIGFVSSNAYLSIVVTNNCQRACPYCINSETDHSLNLPIEKSIANIKKLVNKYNIKEAILLGGEPLLHPELFELIKRLRVESGLQMIRLTTNGIRLVNNPDFLLKLIDREYGIQGLNISFHNEEFMTYSNLSDIYSLIKLHNPNIKVRINTNIWRDNLDLFIDLYSFITKTSKYCDEMRISNIIPKDSFSVNDKNPNDSLVLSNDQYESLFTTLIDSYSDNLIIENNLTLGFVKYVLIARKTPIIINWNINSKVSDQVCENNIENRQINTFKCLVNGDISLSWNESNILKAL